MAKGKNSVPERWHNYQPLQKCIAGTRFMPIKVPLREGICANMKKEQRFTPAEFLGTLADKKLTLGLIIDLTFTTRYYNPEEFTNSGIRYAKVAIAGQSVPSKHDVKRFSEVVKEFEDANESNDSVIAVHCTHGVNRSGYLICRYMIENLSFSPDDAIEGFKEARGHGIEREPYLASLRDLNSTTSIERSEETNEETCREATKRKSPLICDFEPEPKRHNRCFDRSVHIRPDYSRERQFCPPEYNPYDYQFQNYQQRDARYDPYYQYCQPNSYRRTYNYHRDNFSANRNDRRDFVDLFQFHSYPEREYQGRSHEHNWQMPANTRSRDRRKMQRT